MSAATWLLGTYLLTCSCPPSPLGPSYVVTVPDDCPRRERRLFVRLCMAYCGVQASGRARVHDGGDSSQPRGVLESSVARRPTS